jgi:hypothetical protein
MGWQLIPQDGSNTEQTERKEQVQSERTFALFLLF